MPGLHLQTNTNLIDLTYICINFLDMQIRAAIESSIKTKQELLSDPRQLENIARAADLCIQAFQAGGKILLCGNGGSASDAQHIAAELSGRFQYDRPPLYAEALHVNTSYITAVANDYAFDEVYSRMVEAAGKPGDILIGLSTSGRSANVIRALQKAQAIGMTTIGLTGESVGDMQSNCNLCIQVPSGNTARIQEVHILIGHILCEQIELRIFPIKPDEESV